MISKIYTLLYQQYGPQGWWPIQGVYKTKKEYTAQERWEIILGAILTQNAAWKNVEKALQNLPTTDPQVLKNNPQVSTWIRSAGYFNQKTKTINSTIAFFQQYPTLQEAAQDKELRQKLLQVKGIGPETADSILLYALQQPYFVVDTYTKRIFARVGVTKAKVGYEKIQQQIHKKIDTKNFNEFHALLVEHAKRHCTKQNPRCTDCPLNRVCTYAKTHK